MAYTFVKFPKKYLLSEEWHKPRKYTRAEALLYLISESEIPSIGYLAKVFQWSKSTVHSFINEMVEQGFAERKSNDLPNENRTLNQANIRELQQSAERKSNDLPNENRTLNQANIRELQQSAERKSNDLPNENRTLNQANIRELQQSAERKSNDLPNENRTLTKEIKNITPLIISSSKEESIICPPIGEDKNINLGFIKFQEWILENAPRVARMKEPFTEIQYFAIKRDFDTDFICDLLMKMHNYEPLLTKNRNANLTFRNWAKRQQGYESSKPANQTSNAKPSHSDLARAVAEGFARANTPQGW